MVRAGDTLAGVALSYGVPLYQLAAANGLSAYSWLYTGQTLALPSCTATPTYPSNARIHIVQRGENLYRIGLAYGVLYTTIAAANGITDPVPDRGRAAVGDSLIRTLHSLRQIDQRQPFGCRRRSRLGVSAGSEHMSLDGVHFGLDLRPAKGDDPGVGQNGGFGKWKCFSFAAKMRFTA